MGDIERRQQGEEGGAVVRVVPRIAAVPAAEWDACARGVQPVCKLASPARLRRHLVYLTPGTREHSAGW